MSATHNQDEELISTSEAARILHVSADTARRYADRGLIPSTRSLTNQRRFVRSDIEAQAQALRPAAVVR